MLEPVQGEGGFVPMPLDFPRRLQELCAAHGILYVDDEVQAGVGRTGPVWAIEHYGVDARPARLGQVARRRAAARRGDRPRRADGRRRTPGGLGGTFGGNPVACAAAAVVLDTVATPAFRARAEALGRDDPRRGCERARRPSSTASATCAASARCWRSSSSRDGAPATELAAATIAAARERGLLLLSCGLVRQRDPAAAAGLDRATTTSAEGLDALEASLREAAAA